jgi:hypothetical protein
VNMHDHLGQFMEVRDEFLGALARLDCDCHD